MNEWLLLYVATPLCVGLFLFLVAAHKHINRVDGEIKSLIRENDDLRAKLKQEAEKNQVALSAIRQCYDNEIEREKKQIEGFHAGRIEKLKELIDLYERSNDAGILVMNLDEADPDDPAKKK